MDNTTSEVQKQIAKITQIYQECINYLEEKCETTIDNQLGEIRELITKDAENPTQSIIAKNIEQ